MEPLAPPGTPEAAPDAYRGDTASTVYTTVFGIVLAVLAVLYGTSLFLGLSATFDPAGDAAQQLKDGAAGISADDIWVESAANLLLLGLIPVAWIYGTRVVRGAGTLRYLHLERTADAWKDLRKGVGLGLLMFLAIIVLSVLQLAITGDLGSLLDENTTADSPLVEAFAREMTWPLALFIAFVAGTAEEVFFRGVLQRWIGWWGQAILFGLTHAGYGTVAQIVVPFGIGLLFGWMMRRGHSLYLLMAAHFTYDFVQLALLNGTSGS